MAPKVGVRMPRHMSQIARGLAEELGGPDHDVGPRQLLDDVEHPFISQDLEEARIGEVRYVEIGRDLTAYSASIWVRPARQSG
jgi:hypothetical protein